MLSPSTPFREEVLVDVEQDRQTEDAAATLASLYASAQVLQGDLTVARTPSGAVSDSLAMADRTTKQPVAAFWEIADELHLRRGTMRRQSGIDQSQVSHSATTLFPTSDHSVRDNVNPFTYTSSGIVLYGGGGMVSHSSDKRSSVSDRPVQTQSVVNSARPQVQAVVSDGISVASKRDTEKLAQVMGQLSESLNKFGQILNPSPATVRQSEVTSSASVGGRSENVVPVQSMASSGPHVTESVVSSNSYSRNVMEDGNKKSHNNMKPQTFDGKEPVHSS